MPLQPKAKTQSASWPIGKLPGLTDQERSQLYAAGINTTIELIQQTTTPAAKVALASKLHVHIQYVNKWVALADLARIPGVGLQYCGLLLHAGIASVAGVAQIPTHRLHKQIMRLQVATLQRRDLCPAMEQIQQWSQDAQKMGIF